MAINLNDDYDKLANILYPSIEASGNVYYGQTRKLTMDEVFDKYNGGFESHIESRRIEDSSADYGFRYEKYFCWKLGHLSDEFCIDGDGEHHIPLESYPLYYAKYLLNKNIVTEENILNSGVYNSYHYDVNAVLKKVFYHGGKNPESEDSWDGKSFYVINDGTNDYLYIAVTNGAYDESDLLPEEYDPDNPLCIKLVYEKYDDPELPLSDCRINIKLASFGSVSNKNIYQCSFDKQQWSDFDIDASPVMMTAYDGSDNGPESKLYIRLKENAIKDAYTAAKYVYFYVEQVDGIGHIDVLGDIRSMQQDKHVLQSCEFFGLFFECSIIHKLPDLPCMNLSDSCYNKIFSGCTSALYPPRLYATKLAFSCYANMFSDCSSLIKPPQLLLASNVPQYAYSYMFYNCSSLKSKVYIFGSDFKNDACYSMFNSCSKVHDVYCAVGDITSGANSFVDWLDSVDNPIIHTSKHAEWSTSITQIIPSGTEFKYDFELEYTYDD